MNFVEHYLFLQRQHFVCHNNLNADLNSRSIFCSNFFHFLASVTFFTIVFLCFSKVELKRLWVILPPRFKSNLEIYLFLAAVLSRHAFF